MVNSDERSSGIVEPVRQGRNYDSPYAAKTPTKAKWTRLHWLLLGLSIALIVLLVRDWLLHM